MTRPIVVATDFSARADRAIDHALMLGAQWRAPVALVHAVTRKAAEQMDSSVLEAKMRSVRP